MIGQGVAALVSRGARNIVVVPLLLFSAGHDQQDIPAAVEKAVGQASSLPVKMDLAGKMPAPRIIQADHLGCDPLLLELSRRRFTESLQGRADVPASDTCLLLVGRGSREESATAEMHEFARLRTLQTPVGATEVAFLAMAQPSVRDILPQIAAQNWRRIVVQPHLLFQGLLLEELAAEVRTIAARHPHQEWMLVPHLAAGIGSGTKEVGNAADDLLVSLVLQRYQQAAIRIVGPPPAG